VHAIASGARTLPIIANLHIKPNQANPTGVKKYLDEAGLALV